MPSHTRRRRDNKRYVTTRRRIKDTKQIVVPPLNKAIKPGDDFYNYVNSFWQKKTKLVPSESSFGISEEIEHNIRSKLIQLIKNLIQNESRIKSQHEKALAIFY